MSIKHLLFGKPPPLPFPLVPGPTPTENARDARRPRVRVLALRPEHRRQRQVAEHNAMVLRHDAAGKAQ